MALLGIGALFDLGLQCAPNRTLTSLTSSAAPDVVKIFDTSSFSSEFTSRMRDRPITSVRCIFKTFDA